MSQQAIPAMRDFEQEDDLAVALIARDPRAWRQLFEEQYQRVYSYAYFRTGNTADAEDIAASVFAEAVRGIRGFQYRGAPVAAWIFRIAHHETVDLLKRRKRAAESPLDDQAPVAAHGDHYASSDEWRDVARAMGGLNTDQQQVLTLRLIEGRSVAEVAAITGKTRAAVKMTQMRALRTLRSRLGD
jgi:RNA polymerase sigma-70 factor (ECF subfamily)